MDQKINNILNILQSSGERPSIIHRDGAWRRRQKRIPFDAVGISYSRVEKNKTVHQFARCTNASRHEHMQQWNAVLHRLSNVRNSIPALRSVNIFISHFQSFMSGLEKIKLIEIWNFYNSQNAFLGGHKQQIHFKSREGVQNMSMHHRKFKAEIEKN